MTSSPLSYSKKRFLIVSPPYRLAQMMFPLGLMYIAAVLRRAGHHVEVIDLDVANLPRDEYLQELKKRDYDYFCLGGMITAWNFVVFSSTAVKNIKPHVKIIVGGGIVSSTPKSLLEGCPAVDVGCIGEGEEAILDIVDAFENGTDLSTVPGIVYRGQRKVIRTGPRSYIQDLDGLPLPAWDLFDVGRTYTRYPSHHNIFHAKRMGSISTTRGCPFKCTFCYTEKSVRQHSIARVIEEIQELKHRYGVRYIRFADDLFVVRKQRAIEFCEAMIKDKVNVKWSAAGRCNIIYPEFLEILKAAGCHTLGLGIESGSDTILRAIKKKQDPEMVIRAVKMVREAGITPGGTFILGLPGETPETVRETVEVYKTINRYRTHANRFFFATPYPGTELYRHVQAAGKISDEINYFELISERGDAVDFVVNCTDAFTDEELIRTKTEIEKEVFRDFKKKHPWYALMNLISTRTPLGKINNLLVIFKIKGFREGLKFLIMRIKVKLRLIPDPYRRHWNVKQHY